MTQQLCAMSSTCLKPISHIDEKGFIYCAYHGPQRRSHGTRCRKLRPSELKRVMAGHAVERY